MTPIGELGIFTYRVSKTLRSQLAEIGLDPEDIECDAITIQMSRLANMRRPKT